MLASEPYYWVVCDGCQKRIDYGEYTAWQDPDHAIDIALDSEWSSDGTQHHCLNCPVLGVSDE